MAQKQHQGQKQALDRQDISTEVEVLDKIDTLDTYKLHQGTIFA
jgi:hypothetical protein